LVAKNSGFKKKKYDQMGNKTFWAEKTKGSPDTEERKSGDPRKEFDCEKLTDGPQAQTQASQGSYY